jgi:uncharacterized FlaG/YvyC family protein
MKEMNRTTQEKMEAAIHSVWSELCETIQQWIKNVMTHINHQAQSLQKELTYKIDER